MNFPCPVCPLCRQEYVIRNEQYQTDRYPVTLVCGDSCCQGCIKNRIKEIKKKAPSTNFTVGIVSDIPTEFPCPVCLKGIEIRGNLNLEKLLLPPNKLLESLVKNVTERTCSHFDAPMFICINTNCTRNKDNCLDCWKVNHRDCSQFFLKEKSNLEMYKDNPTHNILSYLQALEQDLEHSYNLQKEFLVYMTKTIQVFFIKRTIFIRKIGLMSKNF